MKLLNLLYFLPITAIYALLTYYSIPKLTNDKYDKDTLILFWVILTFLIVGFLTIKGLLKIY